MSADALIAATLCTSGGFLIGFTFGQFHLRGRLLSLAQNMTAAYDRAERQRRTMLSAAGKKGRAKQMAARPVIAETERETRNRKTNEMRAAMGMPPIKFRGQA